MIPATTPAGRPRDGYRRRRAVAGVLAAAGVGLLAFDDVGPLRAIGGGILASPGWIPILLAAPLVVRGSGLLQARVLWGACAAVAAYAVALTVITVIVDPSAAYGELPAAKGFRVLGAFLIWTAVLLAGYVLCREVPRRVLIGVAVMFGVMLAGAVLHRAGVHLLDDALVIHSGGNFQQRVRSTRFEASSLGGGMLAAVALGTLLLRQRGQRFWCCLIGLILVVAFTESRGTELIAAAGIVLLLVLQLGAVLGAAPDRRVIVAVAAVVTVAALASSIGLELIVQSDIWRAAGLSDGARGTSDATRAGWASVSAQVLTSSPLGLGFGSYLQATPRLLEQAIAALTPSYSPMALAELRAFAQGVDDSGVSPKTAPTLAGFHLGWLGVLALGTLWTVVLVDALGGRGGGRAAPPVFVSAVCVLFVAAGYYSSLTSWEQALLFGGVIGYAGRSTVRHRIDTFRSARPVRRIGAGFVRKLGR